MRGPAKIWTSIKRLQQGSQGLFIDPFYGWACAHQFERHGAQGLDLLVCLSDQTSGLIAAGAGQAHGRMRFYGWLVSDSANCTVADEEMDMAEQNGPLEPILGEQRRRFLRLAGSAAVLLPITVITGCGNDAPPAAPPPSPPAAQPTDPERVPAEPEPAMETAPEAVPEATPEPPAEMAAESLPELDLNHPTAQALGYQHDAALVDPQQFPQFRPGHLCSNCALYTGAEGNEWGPCGLFPGKAVNAGGWCNAWAPRRG